MLPRLPIGRRASAQSLRCRTNGCLNLICQQACKFHWLFSAAVSESVTDQFVLLPRLVEFSGVSLLRGLAE